MDTSLSDSIFASSTQFLQLPPETQAVIRSSGHDNPEAYLTTLSKLALEPSLTGLVLTCYQPVFADLVLRWPLFASPELIAAAFGRILPLQLHLLSCAESFLSPPNSSFLRLISHLSAQSPPGELESLPTQDLVDVLLSLYRLLNFRKRTFFGIANLENILPLRNHASRVVQYLAVKSICICLSATDGAEEQMLSHYLGDGAVIGIYEGQNVDYGFLTALEMKRLGELQDAICTTWKCNLAQMPSRLLPDNCLSPGVANLCGVLVPRLKGPPPDTSGVVSTPSTQQGIRTIALALLSQKPILITGPAGCGKSFMIYEVAKSLSEAKSLVSIHLGDQTDAKLLIGAYTAGNTPGSFEWQPGVLTTAVKEGRWVLFEDIDKAPADVLGVLLPLVENGELYIPSRGESVVAARGFRIIATMRTTGVSKVDSASTNLLGSRLWYRIELPGLPEEELHIIIQRRFPRLSTMSSALINVYKATSATYKEPAFFAISKTSLGRPVSPQDLFKWCSRIDALLEAFGYKEILDTISDQIYDDIFKEAVDCFAGSLQTSGATQAIVQKIAEEMHIPPTRAELFLAGHAPTFRVLDKTMTIGRAKLLRRKGAGSKREIRPFAATKHVLRLLEQIGIAVHLAEPVLLVGETGTGKTAVVQYLAEMLGRNLIVINLSQQTESGDLLGGYKPVDIRMLAVPLKDRFEALFERTFSLKRNAKFIEILNKSYSKQQWAKAMTLWKEAVKWTNSFFEKQLPLGNDGQPKRKKRKVDETNRPILQAQWAQFARDLANLESQSSESSRKLAFSFIEGSLVKAARTGDWVLLDEINLTSPDTLESIGDLLERGKPGILLAERGCVEWIDAHPDFRIFGCMNPATDVGKRDLPPGIRSRFTELFVPSPDDDLENLVAIVSQYVGHLCLQDERAPIDVAQLYLEIKKMAEDHHLVDGAGQKPHFSLRTLTRTLLYVNDISSIYGLRRSLYEGFCMSFLTLLDHRSEDAVILLLDKYLLAGIKNVKSLVNQIPKRPSGQEKEFVQIRHYWISKGGYPVQDQPNYIITPFIEKNLLNLIRATTTKRFPVLIQGPTSSGKTSMIEYVAKRTGHNFVRINNHEHTDLQEYLGTYVSDGDGKLKFQEGILVEALRKGHWLVLDELNLAPTDVLEALNRLLDDNRELLIPETQEVVKPHKDFMLFATQNPPGLYGGRKVLSRAFRNRFLELHFLDIPEDELEVILRERCKIAPSYCTKIVAVYKELSVLRQTTRLFESKNSFATLRDLFRWANREAVGYQHLAEHGFMLLAERVRREDEKLAVKTVIEKIMKVSINVENLYAKTINPEFSTSSAHRLWRSISWTKSMRRLYALVYEAVSNNEPVLLVGDTGCGKTTVCQMLAQAFGKELRAINAHQNTEAGDIIGAQRPVRNRSAHKAQLFEDLIFVFSNHVPEKSFIDLRDIKLEELLQAYCALDKSVLVNVGQGILDRIEGNRTRVRALFEWSDGSLVTAMKGGDFFLLDEISLADDSVLERLNSVLESERTILLAEKGPEKSKVTASDGFQFLATMNPGGDYGKRELSPALRNRFTEIWVPAMNDLEDILQVVSFKLAPAVQQLALPIVRFARWYSETYRHSLTNSISIRDILTWATFVNVTQVNSKNPAFGLLHGAAMVFIDGLGANPSAILSLPCDDIYEERQRCVQYLSHIAGQDLSEIWNESVHLIANSTHLKIGPFELPKNQQASPVSFIFDAPTTSINAMRVIRAMQLKRPVLLEGSPGVGKTSLISALAAATGNTLTRINLSEQTDLMDLFGADVPVDGGQSGEFEWREAPFLQAMQQGFWVLLDEMNLASQSVLEGLNSCLDHRGEAYIAELDRTFTCHPNFVVFAAQNPHHQGGGRKGLPASFVNRFTVVYVEALSMLDLEMISSRLYPSVGETDIRNTINFVAELNHEVTDKKAFGALGAPWEFNLRDSLRWLQLTSSPSGFAAHRSASDFVDIIFKYRFRNQHDRNQVDRLYTKIFHQNPKPRELYYQISQDWFQVGHALLPRRQTIQLATAPNNTLLIQQLGVVEAIMTCIQQKWPCFLVGPSGCGKSSAIKAIASIVGAKLDVLPLNADVDAMDIVGGFEQVDTSRHITRLIEELRLYVQEVSLTMLQKGDSRLSFLLQLLAYISDDLNQESLRNLAVKIRDLVDYAVGLGPFLSRLELLTRDVQKPPIARFEWVDGMLVRAVQEGRWLILDNANLCSPSVLDRLNSLLEPKGKLILNEHSDCNGQPRLVEPHRDFRIFITMDPRYGELSRAMRNRGIEIFMDLYPAADAMSITEDQARMQLSKLGISVTRDPVILTYSMLDPCPSALLAGDYLDISLKYLPLGRSNLLLRWKTFLEQAIKEGVIPKQKISNLEVLANHIKLFSNHQLCKNIDGFLTFSLEARNITQSDIKSAQPCYPLVNSALLLESSKYPPHLDPFNLATYYDILITILKMKSIEENIVQRAATAKLGGITFLEISASRTYSLKCQETGARLFDLLSGILAALEEWSANPPAINPKELNCIDALVRLWQDLFRLSNTVKLDESIFQVYITLFNEWIAASKMFLDYPLVEAVNSHVVTLGARLRLTTGFSMETIWNHMHPAVPRTLLSWEAHLKLTALATRFDSLLPQFVKLPDEICNLRRALASTLSASVLSQYQPLDIVEELNDHILELEGRGQSELSRKREFFFTSLFDHILKSRDLDIIVNSKDQELDDDLILLCHFAARPTSALLQYENQMSRPYTGYELVLEDFWTFQHGQSLGIGPQRLMNGEFCQDMLAVERIVHNCSLEQLPVLQSELRVLGRQLVLSNEELFQNHLLSLTTLVLQKLERIFHIHHKKSQRTDDFFSYLRQALNSNTVIPFFNSEHILLDLPNKQFVEVARQYFLPAISAIAAIPGSAYKRAVKLCGKAWAYLSIGCLKLYVPNCSFDPALKPIIQRERYLTRKKELEDSLDMHKAFLLRYNGQTQSAVTSHIRKKLQELGQEPPHLAIVRPAESQMELLHDHMSTILQAVVLTDIHERILQRNLDRAPGGNEEEELFQKNLAQIISRLQSYPHYKDLVDPLIGFLYSLRLGLSISSIEVQDLQTIPVKFLDPTEILNSMSLDLHELRTSTSEVVILLLWYVSTQVKVEKVRYLDKAVKNLVHHSLEKLFQHWKIQEMEEKEKAQACASLYRYKGSEGEDDESNIREIFPDYEEEQRGTHKAMGEEWTSKETASEIAHCLASMLFPEHYDGTSLRTLISRVLKFCSKNIGLESLEHPLAPTHLDIFFPAYIVALRELENLVSGPNPPTTRYNFYKDQNIEQALKLVAITQKIQDRIFKLMETWPENISLQDAYEACQQLVCLPISTPVAKFLVKVEKLHGVLNEWQSTVSVQYSTATEYDAITQLIISWRSLELQSWPRLFDAEDENCQKDANSWWFFLYESLIHNPMQLLLSGQSIDEHILQLLAALSTFIKDSTSGQFEHRLRLLRVFEQHIMRLLDTDEFPRIKILGNAIHNLISYFTEYTAAVAERLAAERKKAEKDIREVVLLASWKETTILSLRESARKSHFKLYKIVHQYRQAQDSPVSSILQNGMPDVICEIENIPEHDGQTVIRIPHDAEAAQSICSKAIKNWETKPRRLQDASFALEQMIRLAIPPSNALDVASEIEIYTGQIISTVKELQSETPSFLSEDNKDKIKHLKSRKRKAFTDALKALREMGLKENLSSSQMATLESVEKIFSETAPADSSLDANATKYYFRVLEVFWKVQGIRQKHSGDLAGPEVHRSVGYIEHLVYLANQQRNELNRYRREYSQVAELVSKYRLLASTLEDSLVQLYGGETVDKEDFNKMRRMYLWLPQFIDLALEGLKAYTSFSGIRIQHVECSLNEWRKKTSEIGQLFKNISDEIWDPTTKSLMDMAFSARQTFGNDIMAIQAQHPSIAYITKQTLRWLSTVDGVKQNRVGQNEVAQGKDLEFSVSYLDKSLQTIAESIFVAIQNLKKCHEGFPTNREDQRWFVNYHIASIRALKSTHMSSIASQLTLSIEQLCHIKPFSPENPRTVRALFVFYLPIIQRFKDICFVNISRLASLHRTTAKMTYILSKSAVILGTKGFCKPAEESDQKDEHGQVESGTGLGEGEGAEDISKDIGTDDDLSELAQGDQKDDNKSKNREDEEDAVEVEDNMNGELEDAAEKEDGKDEDGKERKDEHEMDEEIGEVDGLDPNAVDEKLWDEKGNESDREKEMGEVKGQAGEKDEIEAKKGKNKEESREGAEPENMGGENEEEETNEAVDENDEVRPEERSTANHDIPQADTLDLPEDMDLTNDENEGKEETDDLEYMSDLVDDLDNISSEGDKLETEQFPEAPEQGGEDDTISRNEESGEEDRDGQDYADEGIREEGEQSLEPELEDHMKQTSEGRKASEKAAPSDAQGIQPDEEGQQLNDHCSSVRQETGKENTATEPRGLQQDQGQGQAQNLEIPRGREEEFIDQDTAERSTFKKLGDVLQKWHRQQREIFAAQQEQEQQALNAEENLQNTKFEHLSDEEAVADTQALGNATQDQAQSIDDAMTAEGDVLEKQPCSFEEDEPRREDSLKAQPEEARGDQETSQSEYSLRNGVIIGTPNPLRFDQNNNLPNAMDVDTEEALGPNDALLSYEPSIIDSPSQTLRSIGEARGLWRQYEQATRDLSLGLCEQLRLILEPTLSTKMGGDFRTGKRLNIKRIIPYIASEYKKDKIWMRRTKPSKRQYQVLLALDDSKSMAESPSTVSLAFETITLIAKALSMLEVGQISIIGFGETAKVLHPFEQPFTSEAGAKVLKHFTFSQLKTNIRELLKTSLSLFDQSRAISAHSVSSSGADLWQLQIIISDGVCEDHMSILQLARQAQEKKIMIVFVIIDALRDSSILDMNQVTFDKDGGLEMERYLSKFPFGYYLVVKDVKELPAVLAGALRQWLTEIVEASS